MKAKIMPAGSVCASVPFESQTSKSLSPSPHLDSHDDCKACQSQKVSMSTSTQECRTKGMVYLALGAGAIAVLALSTSVYYALSSGYSFFGIW